MEIIKPYTSWVRSFSCTDGNELIAKVAKENGLKTLVGAWLGEDPEALPSARFRRFFDFNYLLNEFGDTSKAFHTLVRAGTNPGAEQIIFIFPLQMGTFVKGKVGRI